MPLVITMRKGHDVYIDDRRIVCTEVVNSRVFEVTNDVGQVFTISEGEWTEVYPDVKFMAGVPKFQGERVVRAMISAPDLVHIVRGDLYHSS